jgi:membrane protein DedA with SNARE-associated domain
MVARVVMMGWIVGEILLLEQTSAPQWTQVFYFAVGLVMAMLGLMVWRAWRRRSGRRGGVRCAC